MTQKTLTLSALLIASSLLSGCGKKAQLQYEAAQLQATANEQTVALKAAQAESASVGNLGQYNYPQQMHMDQLRAKIKQLRDETESLTAAKATALKDVELLQKELDEYRSRHLQ